MQIDIRFRCVLNVFMYLTFTSFHVYTVLIEKSESLLLISFKRLEVAVAGL